MEIITVDSSRAGVLRRKAKPVGKVTKERNQMRVRAMLREMLTHLDLPRSVKVVVNVDPMDLP